MIHLFDVSTDFNAIVRHCLVTGISRGNSHSELPTLAIMLVLDFVGCFLRLFFYQDCLLLMCMYNRINGGGGGEVL